MIPVETQVAMRSDFLIAGPSSGDPQRPSAWLLGAHLASSIWAEHQARPLEGSRSASEPTSGPEGRKVLPRAPVALSFQSELSVSGQLRAATSTALRNREHHHLIQDPWEPAPPLPGNGHLSA